VRGDALHPAHGREGDAMILRDMRAQYGRIQQVINAAAEVFGVEPEAITATSRTRSRQRIEDARHAVRYVVVRTMDMTLEEVGMAMRRNHSSIINSANRASDLLLTDPTFRARYEAMQALLGPVNGHGGDGHTGEITAADSRETGGGGR
jgi:chromosomal replication initiation ATPase DnaA